MRFCSNKKSRVRSSEFSYISYLDFGIDLYIFNIFC